MSTSDWIAFATFILTFIGVMLAIVRFLILHYLAELRPNSGGSMKDQIGRLESRVDEIYKILLNKSLS